MTSEDLDRLDELVEADKRNEAKPGCAWKLYLNRDEMDRYNAWCDRDTNLAREARTAIPTLVAEVRRLRYALTEVLQCDDIRQAVMVVARTLRPEGPRDDNGEVDRG
jgi:hypothetical protein